jgi:peptide/nickel transport system permease protein
VRGARRLRRQAALGASLLLLLAASAVVIPSLSPYRFDEVNLTAIRRPPSLANWMGTDELGRDVATRLMVGARISLAIGLAGALVATLVGAGSGALAGYYGGWIDAVAMRAADLLLAVPLLPVLIVVSAFTRPGVVGLVLLLAAFAWMETARITRALFLSLREREFAQAARAIGASGPRIVLAHLLPNALGPLSVSAALLVGRVIVVESVLSFLGLGVQPPVPSWGNMLYGAQATLSTEPWLASFPGIFIFVTVLAVNVVGEELRASAAGRSLPR